LRREKAKKKKKKTFDDLNKKEKVHHSQKIDPMQDSAQNLFDAFNPASFTPTYYLWNSR
jgi:hypothetical protein